MPDFEWIQSHVPASMRSHCLGMVLKKKLLIITIFGHKFRFFFLYFTWICEGGTGEDSPISQKRLPIFNKKFPLNVPNFCHKWPKFDMLFPDSYPLIFFVRISMDREWIVCIRKWYPLLRWRRVFLCQSRTDYSSNKQSIVNVFHYKITK